MKYPLGEVLFLVTCATIAGCDDYDEIALWGRHHLPFLRGYAESHFGTPKDDWLRTVIDRIDPTLFEACFTGWALSLRPDAPDLIALDGKSLRRSGDGLAGQRPLHLVSAWASTHRLVLAQQAVDSKENECAALLAILGRLDLKGALVTIDAIATNPTMAEASLSRGGHYLLALKRNQTALHREVEAFFADPATIAIETLCETDKDHGRVETRTTSVCAEVDWVSGSRRHPGEPRFPGLASLVRTTTRAESRGTVSEQTRYFITSARLSPAEAARAVRSHWGIESLNWGLDVRLQGRSPPPAPRPRRAQHGPRAPLRLQRRPGRARKALHQNRPKGRRLVHRLPRRNPQASPLTWTRRRGHPATPVDPNHLSTYASQAGSAGKHSGWKKFAGNTG